MSEGYDAWLGRARRLAAPVAERLSMVAEACRRFEPAYDSDMERFVARLVEAEAGSGAPALGETMPDFVLPDSTGRVWRLDRLREQGQVVLAFHRGGWCDFCQINLQALAEAEDAMVARGGRLVAIAPQRARFGELHRADAGARFPMLADIDGGYAGSIGLTVPLDEALLGHLQRFGIDLAGVNGDAGRFVPIPATFVLDRRGRVTLRHVDADPRTRIEVGRILQALEGTA